MSTLTNSYLTILGALLVVFVSAQMPVVPKGFVAALVTSLITFALLIATIALQPGALKWFFFALFVFAFGQSLSISVQDAAAKGILDEVLASTVGITLAVTVLAFWDTGNKTLGWGSYLFAGLIGLLLARMGVLVASLLGMKTEQTSNVLSIFGSVLFAAYLAYDTQIMRLRIEKVSQKGKHDYVDYALGPFLDIVNLFVSLEDIMD